MADFMERNQDVYRELLKVMSKRGGLYAGLDIPEFFELVHELFTPQEAEINNTMPEGPFTSGEMANLTGNGEVELKDILEEMADKGLLRTFRQDGVRYYKAEPMMPGILEFQLMSGKTTDRERKVARLIQAYKEAYESTKGPIKLSYPRSRVITVDRVIGVENTIHTYDQVSSYIGKYQQIAVATCYCRHLALLVDEDTHGMPMEVCMWFGQMAEFAVERLGARKVGKEEAREVLEQSEKAGLVHMSRNVTEDIEFICNCDRWHCRVMQIVFAQSKPGLFLNSGFKPKFDLELCEACETCLERCPASALVMGEAYVPEVDLDMCFGCAVCATGCPQEAIEMEPKPGFLTPPKDINAFEAAVTASQC